MCFASAFTISFLTYIIGDLDDPIHGSFTLSFVVPQCEDLVRELRYNIQCSEIFTLSNEMLHTEA